MRPRKDIMGDYQFAKKISGIIEDEEARDVVGQILTLETLLDIRDLLSNLPAVNISGHGGSFANCVTPGHGTNSGTPGFTTVLKTFEEIEKLPTMSTLGHDYKSVEDIARLKDELTDSN